MKKTFILFSIGAIVAVASCRKHADNLETTAYLDLPTVPYNYSGSSGTSATQTNHRATLGRVLFYDTHLSVNNSISCGSCHKQTLGFADNAKFSRGFEGRLTGRNSPGFNKLAPTTTLFWDGREKKLDNLIMRPISNHVEMGISDLNTLPAKLGYLSYYKPLFAAAYGDSSVTLERISLAVSAFIQSVGSTASASASLSAIEQQGETLFHSVYNCSNCHFSGGAYSGGGLMGDIGLDETYTDKGFGAISGKSTDNGLFKVPNLANVALSAPYMHDGRFNTLEEVLDHYSHGIQNSSNLSWNLRDSTGNARQMNIPESDKKAIIAFLNTLTDHSTNTDPKFSNPFKVKQ